MKILRLILGCFFAVAGAFSAEAQEVAAFPSKPGRIIVSSSAGAITDIIGRMVGVQYAKVLGHSYYVENIPGASGAIGWNLARRAPPDGYSVYLASGSSFNYMALSGKVTWTEVKASFEPITQLTSAASVLAVSVTLPVTNFKEFVSYAKARPGQLNYASGGAGSSSYFATELLKRMAGLDMVEVPFKGVGPGVQSIVTGQTQLIMSSASSTSPFVKSGKLRWLAMSAPKRFDSLPDLPTIAELGLPGYRQTSWIGLLAPGKTPRPAVEILNKATREIMRSPVVAKVLLANGENVSTGTPEELWETMDDTYKLISNLVSQLGVKLDL
jgi:tripartite-type tricarboxylate transporter receptor subunit TctC